MIGGIWQTGARIVVGSYSVDMSLVYILPLREFRMDAKLRLLAGNQSKGQLL